MSEGHDGLTFVELLDVVASCYPHGRGHIVCDNLFAHDTDRPKSLVGESNRDPRRPKLSAEQARSSGRSNSRNMDLRVADWWA